MSRLPQLSRLTMSVISCNSLNRFKLWITKMSNYNKETDEEAAKPFLSGDEINLLEGQTVNQSGTIQPRKLIRCTKTCAAVCLLALVLIILCTVYAFHPISQFVFSSSPMYGLSNIVIDKSKTRFLFKDNYFARYHGHQQHGGSRPSESIYLTISFAHSFKSTSHNPKDRSCEFSSFLSSNMSASRVEFYDYDHNVNVMREYNQSCFEFEEDIKAAIYETDRFSGLECYNVHWFSPTKNSSLESCIDMTTDNWYGGGTLSVHHWPLNKANVPMQPFITKQFDEYLSPRKDAHFTSFLEPLFLSSSGIAVLLDDKHPLFVSVERQNKICFKSAFEKPYDKIQSSNDNGIHLNYTVCRGYSPKETHSKLMEFGHLQHFKEEFGELPLHPPWSRFDDYHSSSKSSSSKSSSEPKQSISDLLMKPVWSTRGQDIANETSLLSYVGNIKKYDLTFSLLFIDGNYTKSVGSFYFNEVKFPHSSQIIMELDELVPKNALRVGTEVFPFIPDYINKSKNFSFIIDLKNRTSKNDPLLLNVFNEEAKKWYSSQLQDIQKQITVFCFRFSGGDVNSFLNNSRMKPLPSGLENVSLNRLTTEYALIASAFRDGSFIGSGYKSQPFGLIADPGPFLSSWDYRHGLKSVIPCVMTLGLMGYPFMSAGPVGGISRDQTTGEFTLPSKDLYIRWLQLAIFFPVIEFSVGPWEYGPQVVKYAKKLLDYRHDVFQFHLNDAMEKAIQVGTPVIRPLWWVSDGYWNDKSLDKEVIDSEFLVGDTLLVAPILNEGETTRDIYLPSGTWTDTIHKREYKGGQLLRGFPVSQFEIATFTLKRDRYG